MTEALFFTSVTNDPKPRLVDRVVEQITELILARKLHPGTKLPSEARLAESTGVSRTVIREAIQTLVARGLVETHQGIGTIVRQVDNEYLSQHLSMLLKLNGQTLEHLHQVRSIMEVEIAAIAAATATDDELAGLDRYVAIMEEQAADPRGYATTDGDFHRYLARIAHNPFLIMLLDSISTLMYEVRLAVSHHPNLDERSLQDHKRLIQQIRSRSPAGARQAMSNHLQHAREIQEAVEAETALDGAASPSAPAPDSIGSD